MHDVPTGLAAQAVTTKKRKTTRQDVSSGLYLCLAVSPSAERAKFFERAAELQHWHTLISHEPDEAWELAMRYRVQLAMVDLQCVSLAQQKEFRELVRRLASPDGPLLVVCGKENDTKSEVWSRKLGVWMYLPGVSEESNLSLLCSQARSVVEKFEQQGAPVSRVHV